MCFRILLCLWHALALSCMAQDAYTSHQPRFPTPTNSPTRNSPKIMKFLVTSALAFLALAPFALAVPVTTVAAEALTSLKTAQIIPDVISSFVPTATLTVDYGRMTPVKMGEEMLPSEVAKEPVVTFTGTDPKKMYTLVMTDPGVLDIKTLRVEQQSAWQWLHWIVVNVPGDMAVPAAGKVVQPYGPPAPPAGNHRYTFLLFEQKAEINPATPKERGSFDTRAFAAANSLTPVGGFYFLAQPEAAQ